MSKKSLHFLVPPKPSTILFSALLLITGVIGAQERIGVAAAVDTTTTDLTLEQERRLVDEGYKIIQNHTIETDENGKAQMLLIDGTDRLPRVNRHDRCVAANRHVARWWCDDKEESVQLKNEY